jgi:hypothetical protein
VHNGEPSILQLDTPDGQEVLAHLPVSVRRLRVCDERR